MGCVFFSSAICNALNLGFVLSFGVLFPVLLGYFNETKERTGEYRQSFKVLPEIMSGTLSDKSWFGSVLVAVPPDLFFTSDL